ncbi:MAG: DUF424 family protein [Thermoplasmata archaeon]|nr:DUF424 family protein [Thermoplasmata archaeon]
MIMARIHHISNETILAACDSELMGQTLEDEDVRLHIDTVFFGGNTVTEEEFRGMLAQATSANLVGKITVKIAIEMECIHQDAVAEVCGIPYAMLFCMG